MAVEGEVHRMERSGDFVGVKIEAEEEENDW